MNSVFVCLLMMAMPLIGEDSLLRFHRVTLRDGLSQTQVTTIIQDSRHYIWIGTQDGLNLFDGYEIKVLRNNVDDTQSLSDNFIVSLFEDSQQRLWVGTRYGLNLYHRDTESFTLYSASDQANSLANNVVVAIEEDQAGTLWVLTEVGLQRFDVEKGTFHLPQGGGGFTPPPHMLFMTKGQDGLFWIGTREGLFRFDPRRQRIQKPKLEGLPEGEVVVDVLEDVTHLGKVLWLAMEDKGLIRVLVDTGEVQHFRYQDGRAGSLPHDRVRKLILDSQHRLWVGTLAGLALWDEARNDFQTTRHIKGVENSLSSDKVCSLLVDHSGVLWVGTEGGGMNIHNPATTAFKHYRNMPNDSKSLSSSDIETVYKDSQNFLWISTYDRVLHCSLPESDQFQRLLLDDHFSSHGVSAICEERPGFLWLASRGAGLSLYDHDQGSLERILPNKAFTHAYFNVLLKDKAQRLWMGSYGEGLLRRDETGSIVAYRHQQEDANSLSGDTIWSLLEGKNNSMWIGTYSGLNRLDLRTNRVQRYQHDPERVSSISHNGVGSLCLDNQGTLWVGTDSGLNRYLPSSDSFQHYQEKDGLPNHLIYGILEDNSGFLWLSTNGGLSRFNSLDETFVNYHEVDGLLSEEFSSGAAFKHTDGQLFFGGVNGLNAFYPSKLNQLTYQDPPKMGITDLLLFNKKVAVDAHNLEALLPKSLEYEQQLTFNYDQNVFSLRFVGLHFANPGNHRYAYKLDGFNKDWIYTDADNRLAAFTNLNPGQYTFRVKGANGDGAWSESLDSLTIRVKPAPWRSRWAYSAYAIILLSLLLAYAITHQRILAALERKVGERTAQLASKNNELDTRYQELATLDDIVTNINREVELGKLLNTLLEQGCRLIPAADKASFFMYNNSERGYRAFATRGFSEGSLDDIYFSLEDLKTSYFEISERIGAGLYILRYIDMHAGSSLFGTEPQPRVMLGMEMNLEGRLQGLLFLENDKESVAFDNLDYKTLARFHNHVLSAVAKASFFKSLQDKNKEILNKQSQLVTQEKMASLGTLTAGVAHELKNPLNFINGLSDVSRELLEELKDSLPTTNEDTEDAMLLDDLCDNMAIIYKNGLRANRIVESMMALSGGESGRRELTKIPQLISETVQLVYHGARSRGIGFEVELTEKYDTELTEIWVIAQRLNRTLINMLNNAFESLLEKHGSAAGSFTPNLGVSTRRRGELFEISIRDNGMGISADVLPRIYDHFFTTKPPDHGNVGLGLSVSYDIVKEHGGTIHISSEAGVYAQFTIRLPIARQEFSAPADPHTT